MPSGFGTLITDAFGKFNDISKGAFDAYSIKHQGEYDPGFSKLLEEGFHGAAKDVMKKFGVREDQLETFGTNRWTDKVIETIEDMTFDLVATGGALATEAGPLGAAVALIASTSAPFIREYWQEIKDSFSKISPQSAYKAGQWVAIDNGKTAAIRGLHNVLDDEEFNRRRMYGGGFLDGGHPNILEEDVEFEENYSTGFYLGDGGEKDTITVFNLLSSLDEERNLREVRPLESEKAATLDNNEVWSEIRLLRFEDERTDLLRNTVVTDPGSQVIYNNLPYHVIEANSHLIRIENSNGVQQTVDISDLKPGLRSHNNSWNYTPREISSFEAGEKATFSQGDFVWIPALAVISRKYDFCTRQLACIQHLEGEEWVGFTAIDGTVVSETIGSPSVRGVSDDLNEMLASSKIMQTFKDAVVRGHDVKRLAPGGRREMVQLCLGHTPLDLHTEQKKPAWRERATAWLEKEDLLMLSAAEKALGRFETKAGDGGLKEEIDTTNEMKDLGILPSQKVTTGETPPDNPIWAGVLVVGGAAAYFLMRL
jgi:hypothetical protein